MPSKRELLERLEALEKRVAALEERSLVASWVPCAPHVYPSKWPNGLGRLADDAGFWRAAERAADEVATWPAWMREGFTADTRETTQQVRGAQCPSN